MKRGFAVPVLGLTMAAVVIVSAGTEPFGRVLSSVGLPQIGLPFLTTPAARGEVLFAAKAYAAAAEAFDAAEDDFNLGLAAAHAGNYAVALVAWERVLARDPNDAEAQANHTLVTGLLAGTQFDPVARPKDRKDGAEMRASIGKGKARAASTGDAANNKKTGFWMPEVTSEGLRRVPKIFDAQFVAANERWLATMEDQPGRYLRARLKAEQKARIAVGLALPVPKDPR